MKFNIRLIVFTAAAATFFQAYAGDQVANYAKKSGYKSCLSTVSDIENFFTQDPNYGSWAFVAKEKPDDQVLNATLELSYSDGTTLVDFTISPTKDGSCSYTYSRTFYSDKSCIATSKEEYMTNATYKTEINKVITGFEDGSSRILLMPAGPGCIVQKKEIGFRNNKQGL